MEVGEAVDGAVESGNFCARGTDENIGAPSGLDVVGGIAFRDVAVCGDADVPAAAGGGGTEGGVVFPQAALLAVGGGEDEEAILGCYTLGLDTGSVAEEATKR